jgi:NADPH:quinone reductase-like Zn-dependent oxidoreductase
MKANRVHEFGGIDAIIFEEIPQPAPGPGEVLVRVRAAGVGPWDALVRTGDSGLPQPLPLTLGSDLSGVVVSTGPEVADFAPGDEVFGLTNERFTGAYAEYALATARMIAPKPRQLTHVEAASVPVVAVTAWRMVFDHARVAPGQTVLVHGGAGAVGAYAVQLAHRAQARVIATAAADDLSYVRALGADQVIDFNAGRFEEATGGPVDAVIDTVGGETQRRSLAIVSPGGIVVSSVSLPDAAEATRHQIRTAFFIIEVTTPDLARLTAMLDAGDLSTSIGTILALPEARLAHELLDNRWPRPRGKIVLRVDQ